MWWALRTLLAAAGLAPVRRILGLVVALTAVVSLEVATVLDTSWMLFSFVKYWVRRKYGTYPAHLDKYYFVSLSVTVIFGWCGLPLYPYHFLLCNLFEAWQSNAGSKVVRGDWGEWMVARNGKELRYGKARVEPGDADADPEKVEEWFKRKVPAKLANRTLLYKVKLFVQCLSNNMNNQHYECALEVRSTGGEKISVFRLGTMGSFGAVTCFEGRPVDKWWPRQIAYEETESCYNTKLWASTREYTAPEVGDMLKAGMKVAQERGWVRGEWKKFPKPGTPSGNCGSYSVRVMIAVLQKALQGTVKSLIPTPWVMMFMIVEASGRTMNGLGLYSFGVQCLLLLPFPVGDFAANVFNDVDGLRKTLDKFNWRHFAMKVLTLVDSCVVLYVTLCNLPLMFVVLYLLIALRIGLFAVLPAVGRVVGLFCKRCKLPLTLFLLMFALYIGTLQVAAMGERVVGLVNTEVDRA